MTKAKLTFLGTGTSQGIPIIACDCPVCRSTDPRDKRLRASVLVEYGGLTIVVDCGPDFRLQMLRAGVHHLDAVLLTHNHKDHTGGLDELRSFNLMERKPVNVYCEPYVEHSMRQEYSYAFAEPRYPGSPEWRVHNIDGAHPFKVHSNASEPTLVWVSGKGYHY
ncbi:MAG: MBL fold metallo-hydrolase, partial [Bacteroidales bacterium]|nr:MBL fold metallo-hydrolase [Bacteroidales bacterium]